MNRLRIGFVTCVHPFYDLPAIAERRQDAVDGLRKSGCEVVATEVPEAHRMPLKSRSVCEIATSISWCCSSARG